MKIENFVEGSVLRVVRTKIIEFKETKKRKESEEEFAIAKCEDLDTGEYFNLIMTIDAFAQLKENDVLYLKYYYAKKD